MPLTTAAHVLKVAAAALIAVALMAVAADARVGGGFSTGSRGFRTYTPPAVTRTAPTAAAPITRSNPSQASPSPGYASPVTSRPWGSGLWGGLLGAGLFGLLLGYGFFNIFSFAGFMGMVLQLALIGGLAWLFFASRRTAMAGAGSGNGALSGFGFGGGAGQPQAQPPRVRPPLQVAQPDLDQFERILVEAQDAYGRGDVATLRRIATGEMAGFFEGDLSANAAKGLRDEVGGARLLQGDLSEAWRERNAEYATVAMRYSLRDAMGETASGRVVSGSRDADQEVTEVWTFVRPAGGTPAQWRVSAIQQVT